jgi:aryl sulfotransferase
MLILRYEDLHADPVKHFGRLAREVMGIDDEALIAASAADADFSNLRKREEKFGFDEAKSRVNPFFWKGYPYHSLEIFTQKQKDVIWQRHGAVAEAMGYRFEGGKVTLSDIDTAALNGLRKLYEPLINAQKIQA